MSDVDLGKLIQKLLARKKNVSNFLKAKREINMTKKVFISYSHDSAQHKINVLELSNRLRKDGVDARIDRYELSPAKGWPRWMREQIDEADIIIVVCSEIYLRRYIGNEEAGKGLGVNWEGLIISEKFYNSSTNLSAKLIIPVLFGDEKEDSIPIELRSYTYVRLPKGYVQLYRLITDQPEISIPPIGQVKKLKSDIELESRTETLESLPIASSGATEYISDIELIDNIEIEPRKEDLYLKTNEQHIAEVKMAYDKGSLSIIAGAGISVSAGLPTWSTLIRRMISIYVENTYGKQKEEIYSSEIEKTLHNELEFLPPVVAAQFIRSRFSEQEFIKVIYDALYKGINNIAPTVLCKKIVELSPKLKSILTFNFDNLLENAMELANIKYTSVSKASHLSNIQGIAIYHPHGYLPNGEDLEDSSIVFAESDYHGQYLSSYNWTNIVVSNVLMNNSCLFIGTSITDPNLRRLIDSVHRENRARIHYAILFKRKLDDEIAQSALNEIYEASYEQMGIKTIWIEDFCEIENILDKIKGNSVG